MNRHRDHAQKHDGRRNRSDPPPRKRSGGRRRSRSRSRSRSPGSYRPVQARVRRSGREEGRSRRRPGSDEADGDDGGHDQRRRRSDRKRRRTSPYSYQHHQHQPWSGPGPTGKGDDVDDDDDDDDLKKIPGEKEKQAPNVQPTGRLAAETNTVGHGAAAVVLKYHEPPEARKASDPWRLYVFKAADLLDTISLSDRSCWLIGRERSVADYVIDHPSGSKQHAVIQFRHRAETMDRHVRSVLPFPSHPPMSTRTVLVRDDQLTSLQTISDRSGERQRDDRQWRPRPFVALRRTQTSGSASLWIQYARVCYDASSSIIVRGELDDHDRTMEGTHPVIIRTWILPWFYSW